MTTDTHVFTVPGMTCDHCKGRIEQGITPVAGVERVDIDVETKLVTVAGGDADAIRAAISEAGYSAD